MEKTVEFLCEQNLLPDKIDVEMTEIIDDLKEKKENESKTNINNNQ